MRNDLFFHCGTGLGNRLSTLAHAVYCDAPFYWNQTKHWNYSAADTFINVPQNILIEGKGTMLRSYGAFHIEPMPHMKEIFVELLENLNCEKTIVTHALHFRFAHRTREADHNHQSVSEKSVQILRRLGIESIHLFSDQHREKITTELNRNGIEVIPQKAPELKRDLDREGCLDGMLQDFYALNTASKIIVNYAHSTMIHPAIQAGAEIIDLRSLT